MVARLASDCLFGMRQSKLVAPPDPHARLGRCSGEGQEADGEGGGAQAGELAAVDAFGEHAAGEQDRAGRV
ncbi:hypothetical protein Aple_019800 [Acrocarpospora pleiomorpha]|uniref:Uncharacterized protein n=1 Tax=Acrocarpospora pleiomorpha TaxID=90975 RepID=A0A5M3XCZ4_9ACTN|nr:hypothetical protein Aple_019800 [Acrocarpospora pleiomorpha]